METGRVISAKWQSWRQPHPHTKETCNGHDAAWVTISLSLSSRPRRQFLLSSIYESQRSNVEMVFYQCANYSLSTHPLRSLLPIFSSQKTSRTTTVSFSTPPCRENSYWNRLLLLLLLCLLFSFPILLSIFETNHKRHPVSTRRDLLLERKNTTTTTTTMSTER